MVVFNEVRFLETINEAITPPHCVHNGLHGKRSLRIITGR